MEKVGFIGLGAMGFYMAQNLLREGFDVVVYNRTASKAEPLLKEGALLAKRPTDLLSSCTIIITMLANDQALEEIIFGAHGIGEGLTNGHIHISMSTISADLSKRLATYHKERGAKYIVATVSGRPEAAAEKKLWIYLAGESSTKAKVKPLLQTMGQRIFDIGEEPAQGNIIKLCANFLLFSAVEAMSEAFAFATKNHLSAEMIAQILGESLFSCAAYQIYGKIIATEQFKPGFHLDLAMKDVTLLRTAADHSRVPMPLADLLYERFLTSLAKGREGLDWSAIALASFEDAGLDGPKEKK